MSTPNGESFLYKRCLRCENVLETLEDQQRGYGKICYENRFTPTPLQLKREQRKRRAENETLSR